MADDYVIMCALKFYFSLVYDAALIVRVKTILLKIKIEILLPNFLNNWESIAVKLS